MGDYNNIKPTQTERDIAFNALTTQAVRFGVLMTKEVTEFIEHEALVKATCMAERRMLQNTVHEATERGAWANS